MKEKKVKMKFTDFECNLLINGINEWRNQLLKEDYQNSPSICDSLFRRQLQLLPGIYDVFAFIKAIIS